MLKKYLFILSLVLSFNGLNQLDSSTKSHKIGAEIGGRLGMYGLFYDFSIHKNKNDFGAGAVTGLEPGNRQLYFGNGVNVHYGYGIKNQIRLTIGYVYGIQLLQKKWQDIMPHDRPPNPIQALQVSLGYYKKSENNRWTFYVNVIGNALKVEWLRSNGDKRTENYIVPWGSVGIMYQLNKL